jgi:hypothetical protein
MEERIPVITTFERLRVSAAALLRVHHPDRHRPPSLILVDTGKRRLGPLGGAFAYHWPAANLLAGFGWQPEREPDDLGRIDLRGIIRPRPCPRSAPG